MGAGRPAARRQTLVTLNPPSAGSDVGLRTLHTAPAGVALEAPQWSPDGNRIVFVEGGRLRLYDVASGKVSEVAPEGTSPSWSPDGTRIAFLRGGALLTRAPDGSGEQPLPIDATGVRDAAWSPDGAWFALWLGDRLDTVGVDGSEREPFDVDVRGGVAWAPDASSLVYPRQFGDSRDLVGGVGRGRGLGRAPRGARGPRSSPRPARRSCTRGPPSGVRELAWDANGSHSAIRMGGFIPAQPDWQPCVAGVTISCRSVTPLPKLPPLALVACSLAAERRSPSRRAARCGSRSYCAGAVSFELVVAARARHGHRRAARSPTSPPPATSGPDSFTYRAVSAERTHERA